MNREQLIQSLESVRTQQHLLDIKEETLQTMRSIAIEAIHADDARRKVLDRAFQQLKQQLVAIELKIVDSFH
ncbi:hypothetical protein [Exiguobacterium sp. ZOR0005]|uniref:hypothetical protein n=1 Tax=Exiguobacterium sp. ZOR0005 TaxID=1339226 RepID=UPI000647DF4E|nr:hypothetical protein [Exiguobacterium sp. ZOR0005]